LTDSSIVAGYSGTPIAVKLGIKEGSTLALLDAPSDAPSGVITSLITGLPAGVVVRRQARGSADVVVEFVTNRAKLEKRIGMLEKMIYPAGSLWIAWPKRASGIETDVTDHVVRELALPRGLVDNKVCAIDETWTGLRLVWAAR
jgi:hypothetical protein